MRYFTGVRSAALCALAGLVLVAGGCGRGEDGGGGGGGGESSPGISDSEIKLGASYPLSGPASVYGVIAEGAKARFEVENAKGGVDGRKIELIVLDDAYEPQRAVTNTRKLVEQDQVFALFGSLGTANNLAVWDYVNQQQVPHLFLGTGGSEFGADPGKHPYTIGWQPDYGSEGVAYGEYVKQVKPDAKIAVLVQNDSYGEGMLAGFEKAIEGSGVSIVEKQTYESTDPTVASQMRKLSSTGADVFLNISTPKPAAQSIAFLAKSDWKPLHVISSTSASKTLVFEPVGLAAAKDIVSMRYYKDPGSDLYKDDPAMNEYVDGVKKYSKGDPNDEFVALGWSAAATMIEALKQMQEPTRDSLMDAVKNMDTEIPTLIPGIKVQTSPDDYYPIQSMQIVQFDGEQWQPQGDIIDASTTAE
jgi:branched-chain amino acid transport system substrate-binding protein